MRIDSCYLIEQQCLSQARILNWYCAVGKVVMKYDKYVPAMDLQRTCTLGAYRLLIVISKLDRIDYLMSTFLHRDINVLFLLLWTLDYFSDDHILAALSHVTDINLVDAVQIRAFLDFYKGENIEGRKYSRTLTFASLRTLIFQRIGRALDIGHR